MFEDNNFSLSPINFFQISADCYYKKEPFSKLAKQKKEKYKLADTSGLCGESRFADVYIGWNEEGLDFLVQVNQPVEKVIYPEITRGDSVELMIDTRDVKTSGYNTRFCHHFFFLPEAIEGIQAGEMTRFRSEDVHDLCNPLDLKLSSQSSSFSYVLEIFIPAQCLNGYDPDQFDRLGFTYRINRFGGKPQHFSVTTEDYQVEQQPSLWSSLKLVK